jgi:hypothetical protein
MNPNYKPFKQPKTIAQLKKQLWKQFSLYIRQRDKGICFTCGKVDEWKNTDAGHYIAKNVGGSNLYFDEQNVHCQCDRCNRYLSSNGAMYALNLVRKYGNGILERLEAKKKDSRPYNTGELLILIKHYKKLNESFTNNQRSIKRAA